MPMRSGRLTTILEAPEVSDRGDLANWNTGADTLEGFY